MQRYPAFVLGFCLRCAGVLPAALFLNLMLTPAADAQVAVGRSLPMVTQPINDSNLVVLSGNTRPEARAAANDQGPVASNLPLSHMFLQLRRPAAQEQALVALIDQLHDRTSPNFHHWLSAAEIGERFGPADFDVAAVTGWLSRLGFAVNTVYTNRMVIDFSGTADQVRTAFHTEIHNLLVDGVAHIANISDPQIPAALAPVVVGVVSLHDFMPKATFASHDVKSGAKPLLETDGVTHYISPGDIATIYNFKPMFASNINGHGQTIYVVENSDMYQRSDWATFRQAFGIPNTSYNVNLDFIGPQPPNGSGNCFYPGINNDHNVEATLDAEYASAAAPGAEIVIAACMETATSGVLIAVQNLVNSPTPPAIISVSYQNCEAAAGATMNAAINTAYQTGVAEGTSIYAAASDQGAAGCTTSGLTAGTGIGVNAWASTPYNVAVGGTDFEDTYLGDASSYWNVNNAADWSSAKSYIPEIPWNSSCGSQLIAQSQGYNLTYGSSGFCNSSFVTANSPYPYAQSWAGGGGPSGCATGTPSVAFVVSGTCAGYAKPSWQSGLTGVPNDGVRGLPDVSLFSSGGPQKEVGPWHHSYVYCYSDTSRGGTPCTASPSGWTFGGFGTSFATPIWAGIQALINQQTGERWGNPNIRLYQIAKSLFGGYTITCASGGFPSQQGSCIFYDVQVGDTDVPCVERGTVLYNCYDPSGYNGVMSTANTSYVPTYKAQTGWDFATGIGTVNVANLVAAWSPKTGTHDFSSDGRSDILFRSTGASPTTVAMWLMNGSLILSSANVANLANSYTIVGQRDFNGDGHADLLWRDTGGNLYMWFMNGLTTSSSAGLGNVPITWTVKGTGDMNGDGKGDLLWQDGAGDVAIWFMNGSTVSSTASLGTVAPASGWSIIWATTGEILWRDSSGDLALWQVNGSTVQSTGLGNVPNNWVVQGMGDFNGDGIRDLLFRDSTSGTVAIWFLNSSGTVQSTASVASVPISANWSIVETGDFDGDGRSDIFWIDGSGNLAFWYMNGATVSSTAGVANVGTSWSVQSLNAE